MIDRPDLVIKNGAVLPGSSRCRVAIAMRDGTIAVVAPGELLPSARETIAATGLHALPGIVDSGTHASCIASSDEGMHTGPHGATGAGGMTWRIQAPSTRLSAMPFREAVARAGVVWFDDIFPSALVASGAESFVDAYVVRTLESDHHARVVPHSLKSTTSPRRSVSRGSSRAWCGGPRRGPGRRGPRRPRAGGGAATVVRRAETWPPTTGSTPVGRRSPRDDDDAMTLATTLAPS